MKRDWMMTQQEITQNVHSKMDIEATIALHRIKVLGALIRGENVPVEVLSDYPGLTSFARKARSEHNERKQIFGQSMPTPQTLN